MVEIIKKHLMFRKSPRQDKERETRIERFGENLANGYVMSILSGIYSVENL